MEAGNWFILIVIDYYSKWAEGYALPNHRAETVADCIVSNWIGHHGIPLRLHSDNASEFSGHVITQLKQMLSVKGTFMAPYRPESNGLCECMNQMIENIIKCTVRENQKMSDLSLPFVMMVYRATSQSSTGFTQYMLVTSRENNMTCDLIFGTLTSRGNLRNYSCYCVYLEDLRNNLVNAFFKARQCLGDAGRRQKIYYDRDTAPPHFKKDDWVIYWHKPTTMQTLSSGWADIFVVSEKVSVVDYRIQLNPEGSLKVVHVNQLCLDPCHQDRSGGRKGKPVCLVYYLQIQTDILFWRIFQQ